jgi:hypothetical protein
MTEQITTSNAPGWGAWLRNFQKTRDDFAAVYAALLAKAPFIATHPALLVEYSKRVDEARKHQDTLNMLAGIAAQVSPALDDIVRFSQGAFEWSPFGLVYKGGYTIGTWIKDGLKAIGLGEVVYDDDGNQLGIAPIVIAIGLGVATAAIAAVAYFVTDNIKYLARLDSIAKLQAAGYTPEQAAKVVDNQASIQAGVLGNPLMMIALLAGAALVVPMLIKNKGGSNA